MKILSIFRSGRIIDMTHIGEVRVRDFAAEFPTIIYLFVEEEV